MTAPSERTAPPPAVWVFTAIVTALFLFLVEGRNRAAAHPIDDPAALASSEARATSSAEGEATSAIELSTPGAAPTPVRLIQVGNPPRRPNLPDLSRTGRVEFPGRVSLEVGGEGVLWDDVWVPPGIYRIALVSDGMEVRLGAQPLAPSEEITLPIETGTMTRPGGAFRAILSERNAEGVRTGIFSVRWGALYWEAKLEAPALSRRVVGSWTLQEVPVRSDAETETYLGVLTGIDDGRGELEARWVRMKGGEHRLRLERRQRRLSFALRRELGARARWLETMLEGVEDDPLQLKPRIENYRRQVADHERRLKALEGTSREVVGKPRPAASSPSLRLAELEGRTVLIIEDPRGGAEFRLPTK